MTARRQTLVGLLLAILVAAAWLSLHIYGVFFFPLETGVWMIAPIMVAALCWLNVGLFIIAHDCMHGSLAPGRPKANRWIGRIALFLYAGFSFDRLLPKHFAHHKNAGTGEDPDFHAARPDRFWPWYLAFFRQYFGLRELLVLTGLVVVYSLVLGAPYSNLLLFWALPAILSSLQLFLFGTYLPHRQEDEPFSDRHRARSNEMGWGASLMTCFHFGYHHEHHLSPHVPWWQLPDERTRVKGIRSASLRQDRPHA